MTDLHESINLSDYWQLIKKRKNLAIILFTLVILSDFVFTQMTTPVFKSDAVIELRYQSPHLLSFNSYAPDMFSIINRDTEIRKMESYPILSGVALKLAMLNENSTETEINSIIQQLRGKISASQLGDTALIKIIATDSNPQSAIKLANTVAEIYVQKTIDERNKRTSNTRQFIENQLQNVGQQLRTTEENSRKFKMSGKITERISTLGTTLSDLTLQRQRLLTKYGEKHPEVVSLSKQIFDLKSNMGDLTTDELEYLTLMREATINEELYMMLNKKLKEAMIIEADKVIPVGIADPARQASLIKPNKRLNMLIGIILGLILAITGILIMENIDTSLKSALEVETYLKTPVLSQVPVVHKKNISIPDIPIILTSSKNSTFYEAFNSLSASLISSSMQTKIQTILITSAMPKEGKSEIVSNFGIVESLRGNKTLLIDTDFRQPTLNKLFHISRKPGITDLLTEGLNWKTITHSSITSEKLINNLSEDEKASIKNLSIITAGHTSSNPMKFISSPEFKEFLIKMKDNFDIILLDSPPLYYFADPSVLSRIVDGIVLVHKPGSIDKKELLRITEQFSEKNSSNLLGVVINQVKSRIKGKYYYYYSRDPKLKNEHI
ncbi:GumC family protein [Elusimicrobiota bacterium]